MVTQKLQCPCGHIWDCSHSGPIPPNLREICPVCTAGVRSASTPAIGLRGPMPSGPLGFLESAAYVRQAALGLQHAFERGLVHRDIKPANLMVTPSPFDPPPESGPRPAPIIKILDMGLARVESADEALEEGLTL